MSRHRSSLVVTSLAVSLCSVVAVGCGSDGDSSVASTAAPSTAPTTAAPVGAPAVLLSPQEGAALIASMGPALTLIDVRTPEEFAAGHIEGAINFDLEGGQFSAQIAPLDRSATYAVYCHSGRRSALAAQAMTDAGFNQLYDIGGLQDWVNAGLPVVAG